MVAASDLLCATDRLVLPGYGLLTMAVLLSFVVPELQDLASHGKTRQPHHSDNKNYHGGDSSLSWFDRFNSSLVVPKRFFRHFYIVGLLTLVGVVGMAKITTGGLCGLTSVSLLLFHLLRRLYECYCVHCWRETSKMHLVGYLVGILHYLLLPLVLVRVKCSQDDPFDARLKIYSFEYSMIIPSILCLYGQYQQYRHHVLLAKLGAHSKSNGYGLPNSGWFQFIVCPHYLAEIVIYVSFAILLHLEQIHGIRHYALFVWVVSNLTVAAQMNLQYYQRTLPKKVIVGKKAILPNLL